MGSCRLHPTLLPLHARTPAGQKEDKWQAMWKQHGTCAGFDKQADYFGFALAAAEKYNADVSGGLSMRQPCS